MFKLKKLAIFILIIFIGFPLYADFKVLGGLNLSKYREAENTRLNYKLGFQGGIGFELDLSYKILLEFDILFMQKGSLDKSSNGQEKYVLSTVSVPVLLRGKLLSKSTPYIVGGIEIASMLSHKLKIKEEEPVELEETTKRFDFGFVFGSGFEIELEEDLYLFFEVRYHHGIKNLLKDPIEGQWRKTNSIVLLIGVRS